VIRLESALHLTTRFRIHCLNQCLDVTVAEGERLKTARIVRMVRHVVRTDRAGELRVSKNPHDPEEIHLSLVGVNFFKTVQSAPDIAHMDLVDFPTFAEILNNWQNLTAWVL